MASPEDFNIVGWVFGAVGTVGSLLLGGILKLYHKQVADYEKREIAREAKICELEKKVDECEIDRLQIKVDNAATKERVGWLERQLNELQASLKVLK